MVYTYGDKAYDSGNAILALPGGGFIVAGSTDDSGNCGYLLKLGSNGSKLWDVKYTPGRDAVLYKVIASQDGGYLLAGTETPLAASDADALAIKVNGSGSSLWDKTYGGGRTDRFNGVVATKDGGFVFVGDTMPGADYNDFNLYLAKINASGYLQWENRSGTAAYEMGNAIVPTTDNGFLVLGATDEGHAGRFESLLVKVAGSGKELWRKVLKSETSCIAVSMVPAQDGGYVIAGYKNIGGNTGEDFFLAKIDADGNVKWDFTYGGPSDQDAKIVTPTSDGGYLLVGYSGPQDGNSTGYVVKTDAAGKKQWDLTTGDASGDSWLTDAVECPDGGYLCTGTTSGKDTRGYDLWLLKLRGQAGQAAATATVNPTSTPGTSASPSASSGGDQGLTAMLALSAIGICLAIRAQHRR